MTLIILGVIFLNVTLYVIIEINKEERISKSLEKNLRDLQTHYEIHLYHQCILSQVTYEETIGNLQFMNLFSQAIEADKNEKK
ncbi:hypothetical protein [Sulfurimonas sp.]|uniref:hypothetical protein n=1 Tax=Sulfurimonas sp. TaxID=2022749 RepID=UPI0039E5277C